MPNVLTFFIFFKGFVEIPSLGVSILILLKLGRRWPMSLTMAGSGLVCLASTFFSKLLPIFWNIFPKPKHIRGNSVKNISRCFRLFGYSCIGVLSSPFSLIFCFYRHRKGGTDFRPGNGRPVPHSMQQYDHACLHR